MRPLPGKKRELYCPLSGIQRYDRANEEANDMHNEAIALNRFGLGARPDDALPADPRRWLLSQFDAYEARPAAWQALAPTAVRVRDFVGYQRALRQAPEGEREALRAAWRRTEREAYLSRRRRARHARLADALPRSWNGWCISGRIISPCPSTRCRRWAWPAPSRPTPSARRCWAASKTCCWRRCAIRPCCCTWTRRSRPGRTAAAAAAPPCASAIARASTRTWRARSSNCIRWACAAAIRKADVTEFARALTGWTLPDDGRGARRGGAGGLPLRGRDARTGQPHGARPQLSRKAARNRRAPSCTTWRWRRPPPSTSPPSWRAISSPTIRRRRWCGAWPRPSAGAAATCPPCTANWWRRPKPGPPDAIKFKSPWDWAVSSLRALGRRELPGQQAVNLMNQLGQPVWNPGSPAGFGDIAAAWAAPDALVRRVEMAQRLAAPLGAAIDARALAPRVLPGTLGEPTRKAIAARRQPRHRAGAAAGLTRIPEEIRWA